MSLVPCCLSQPLWELLLGMACGRVKRKTGRHEKGHVDGKRSLGTRQSEGRAGCPEGLLLSVPLSLGKYLCVIRAAVCLSNRYASSSQPKERAVCLVQASHQVQRGGGELGVHLADWAMLLLGTGSAARRYHWFGVTVCLGQTEPVPPWACGSGLPLGGANCHV